MKSTICNKFRIIYLGIGFSLLFSALLLQYFRIQIMEGEKWTKEARKQHFFIVKEPFLRGRFLSNTSLKKHHPEEEHSFVIDVEKFHLFIDPISIPEKNRQEISQKLFTFINPKQSIYPTFIKQFKKKSRSRRLAMWLDLETKNQINKWWSSFSHQQKIPRNALFFVSDYQRSYPFGALLGQVLHTIQNQKDEKTKQAIPTGGLELAFNPFLQGKSGKRMLMRSPRNSFETDIIMTLPENGADVELTINHCLQAIAEEELEKGVKKCKAKAGWAVMMNPLTGEVLALAQYPAFCPSKYKDYFNHPELIEHTKVKSITDANEPGSVMKPFTVATSLLANEQLKKKGEKPIFDPKEKRPTSDPHFKGRSKPLVDTHFHRFLNMEMAIQHSSNIYMARLADAVINKMGKEWYRNTLQNCFGFGLKTQIELPAESCGLLPTPGKQHPNGTLEWSVSTIYSLAIGHNIQVTTLQLARAYSVIANGGYLVQPTIVRRVIKKHPDGHTEILLDNTSKERQKQAQQVLSPEICKMLLRAMRFVTKTHGTSRKGNIFGYTEVGKSGTAKKIVNGQYSETRYVGSFAGFAPANKPEFVLVVTMDEPEYGYFPGIGKNHNGGNCSAPVFREIGTRALAYLGVPLDDPHGFPVGDPRHDPEKADWIKEMRELQEIYDSWNISRINNKV